VIKEEPPKEEEAIFKPKRFNLRNKLEKKEDSYMPTIEKKEEKKEEDVYVPKNVLKEESSYIPEAKPKPLTIDPKPEVKEEIKLEINNDEPQVKSRFSLKLKDRQKKNND